MKAEEANADGRCDAGRKSPVTEMHTEKNVGMCREQGSIQDSSSDGGKETKPEGNGRKTEDEDRQKGQVSVGRQEAMAPTAVGHSQRRNTAVKSERLGRLGETEIQ